MTEKKDTAKVTASKKRETLPPKPDLSGYNPVVVELVHYLAKHSALAKFSELQTAIQGLDIPKSDTNEDNSQ